MLFLDEPTTGLDPRGRIDVWNLISEIASRGTTVLITTQYLEEADPLADRISILKQGRVIVEGTPAELKRQRGGERVEVTPPPGMSLEELAGILGVDGLPYPAPNGTADLIDIARRLDSAGITPNDLTLRHPTLDEVFLALTEEEQP